MPSSLGSFSIRCPVCGRDFTIGTTSTDEGVTRNEQGRLVLTFQLNRGDIEAHFLTHGPHDGEPLPVAA